MKKIGYVLLLSLIFFYEASGQFSYFVEYWNQTSLRKTNYSDVTPRSVEDFFLTINSLKAGYRYFLSKYEQKSGTRIGIDIYGRLEFVHDFNNSFYRHDNIFNNHLKYGAGLRVQFQRDMQFQRWLRYLQVDLYSEYQRITTTVDKVKHWIDLIETTNHRSGVNIWANGERQNSNFVNYEVYVDLAHHTTNFSDPGDSHYFILTLSPRIYYSVKNLDLYLNEELVMDFLNQGNWNRNPFSNNLKTVLGLRYILTPFNAKNPILGHASILLFSEYGKIIYLDKVQKWPFQTELADYDFRAGVVIWWPIGESRYRPIGQSPN